ncbi:MAG: hypothetical protein KatS3mg129_2668 [Leptospiraceae bacterium]|nr:MAG: hypothetical protein KatS3mg129_2668 [Leptospiraceae bacterium]
MSEFIVKAPVKEKCFHCGSPVNTKNYNILKDKENLYFCCNGCYNAYLLIQDYGLGSYYTNRENYGEKPLDNYELAIFDVIDKKIPLIKEKNQNYKEHSFYIQGLHCASCVWLNEKVLSQVEGVIDVRVNFSNNRIYLKWNPEKVSLKEIAEKVFKIGYKLHLIDENIEKSFQLKSDSLLKKMAVAGFFTANNMLISVSLYAGYFDLMDTNIKQFFHFFSFLFATPVFFYSASEFFRNAFYSLKHKIISMDILTATGISLAYFYSIWITFSFQVHKEIFFDAVCFVVFAILTGRFIESRLKLKTYYYTTNLGTLIPAFVRKLSSNSSIKSNFKEDDFEYADTDTIKENDFIAIFPEEIIPLDGILENDIVEVDESSITGEFTPIIKKKGDYLISGSKNLSQSIIIMKVTKNKNESTISQLLKISENCLNEKSYAETSC